MLVVTRHMVHFDILDRPVALNPSVNIIAFEVGTSREEDARRRSVLEAIRRYLRSEVADYMFALTGKTWLLDGRRFEKGDLLALPFPFVNLEEAGDPASMESDLTSVLQQRLGLGTDFAEAVQQYAIRRRGYQDAQVPADALDAPPNALREGYRAALQAELGSAFGPRAALAFGPDVREEGDYLRISVRIGLRDRAGAQGGKLPQELSIASEVPLTWTGFNDTCVVGYDAGTSTITIVKPLTVAAWTADRAYADHLRIVQLVATA